MKDEVEEFIHSNRKCSDIVQDKLDKLDKDIKKRMPTTETLNRDMQRHRRRFVKDEKGPKRRDDIASLKTVKNWILVRTSFSMIAA